MNRRLFSIVLFASLAFGCAPKEREGDKDKEKGEVSTIISKVRLKTNKGDIVIQLNAEKAPVTVANFKKYVSAGHYNGTVFHRVINEFMIQGGGYENKDGKLVEKKTGEGIVFNSAGDAVTGLFDAWGQPFYMVIDYDYDGRLDFDVETTAYTYNVKLNNKHIAVYSLGADLPADAERKHLVKTW